MLTELQITNFAIIDKINLSFESGMTVFTGETGSGKSIIIEAVQLLTGSRASSEFIRQGAKKAEIEGLFEMDPYCRQDILPVLSDLGLDDTDSQIILRREISLKGKSVCRVNGKMVTLSVLDQIGHKLIDIHGQRDHHLLLDPVYQLYLLDHSGGRQAIEQLSQYEEYYRKTAEMEKQCRAFDQDEKHQAQRMDLLQYQIKEIGKAQLGENEEEKLLNEKKHLVNYEKIFQALNTAYQALDEENGGLDCLRKTASSLETVSDLDADLKNYAENVSGSCYMLEESASQIRDYLENMAYDPDRLEEIEARLDEIYSLKRKYGSNIKEILDYFKSIQKEYDDLLHHEDHHAELQENLRLCLAQLKKSADALSSVRQKLSVQLDAAVNHELKDLCMENARFQIRLEHPDQTDVFSNYHKNGLDSIEFLISANPGEPLKSLEKIASGGELSRIMLAIKSTFKKLLGIPSIVFDEIDTGVSGRAAQAMAEKVYRLSGNAQILCISHLPQMAAMADHHLRIGKEVTEEGRTKTTVRFLDKSERIQEIGRMISGARMTELTKQHADELLEMAEKIKIRSVHP